MVFKLKIIVVPILIILICFVFSCNDPKDQKKQPTPAVVSKNIAQPSSIQVKKDKNPKQKIKRSAADNNKAKKDSNGGSELEKKEEVMQAVAEHYDPKGKIDPFIPLIQEKTQAPSPVPDNQPKRILTPLEKIELTQIRLVAVIVMKDRQVAMVEEASGKGYEVGVGTYIGKNNGKITQIKKSSIVIKEPVRDFKGRLSERVQEIRLQKNDIEE